MNRRKESDKKRAQGKKRRHLPRNRQGYRALEDWVRGRLIDALGDDFGELPALDLKIELPLRFGGREREMAERRFTTALRNQVDDFIRSRQREERGYEEGHVYCHWCSAPICEHSQPDGPRHVFVGYEPTGRPCWRDFSSWVVERRDERLDRLFDERPRPLSVAVGRDELVEELLPEFGRTGSPYRIAGQLSAGPFAVPNPNSGEDLLALSVQVVERKRHVRTVTYEMNLICAAPKPHHLPSIIEHRVSPVLSRWIQSLRSDLRELDQRMVEALRKGQCFSLKRCRELARDFIDRAPARLEKLLRQDGRRTQHAAERVEDPERPTASAIQDAQRAKDENLFRDSKEGTVLVRGPRNRIHVFRRDGVHVTSIRYPGETVQSRLRSKRWVPLEIDEVKDFRGRVG